MTAVTRRTLVVDGLVTSYLEAGPADGDPVVLLHGGEFGASAELGWERIIPLLATRYRVLAPDQLGYGHSAKVHDFTDGRAMRIRHVARFCDLLGVAGASFAGNSMGAINLLTDACADRPLLPASRIALICGGGEIQAGEHFTALQDYDGSRPAMRRVVAALFADPAYAADEEYVRRRHASSLLPGAWEAVAAARFRRPPAPDGAPDGWRPHTPIAVSMAHPSARETDNSNKRRARNPCERIAVPVLVIEGGQDKLLPPGWAKQLAARIPDGSAAVVDEAGHCPQTERPEATARLLHDFLAH
jgi:pimeloyl-ACP methyl ester carboxylesterase